MLAAIIAAACALAAGLIFCVCYAMRKKKQNRGAGGGPGATESNVSNVSAMESTTTAKESSMVSVQSEA